MTVSANPRIKAPFAAAGAPLPELTIAWTDCPTCWRQGRLYTRDDDGQWWQETCPQCLGVREVIA